MFNYNIALFAVIRIFGNIWNTDIFILKSIKCLNLKLIFKNP